MASEKPVCVCIESLDRSVKGRMANSESRDSLPSSKSGEATGRISSTQIRLNGYIVISSVAAALALVTANECQSIRHLPSLIYGVVLWGWWGVIATVLWKFALRAPSVSSFSLRAISVHLPVALVLGVAHLLFLWSLGFRLSWPGDQTPQSVWRYLFNVNRYGIEILIYGFIFGIVGIIQYQMRAQLEAMKSLELQRQLSAAQLRALQMQLEPHFLFNTLNAITTLVELGRQAEAVEMLGHLNAILKSTLKRTAPVKVPLSQELEMVENYLAIEQVRFADRLHIEMKVDPSALDGLVPCFLLQPIVENAIRYGVALCENEGVVEATAKREGDFLHLRVRDTGPGVNEPQPAGHGIGLRNTQERLAHFYPGEYEMKAQSLSAGGFEVAITIPYERN
jgi:signal transduction histidine kinase